MLYFEAITTFRKKMIEKIVLHSMPLYDMMPIIRIYETFEYTVTRYKRNSVYNNTVIGTY